MSTSAKLTLESTGDAALDALLNGGIPTGSMTVVAGQPGSGKTIFALQMLFHAARQGKKCLYFTTLSEPAIKLLRYMQQFSFFDADLIGKCVYFIDLGGVLREGPAQTLAELGNQIESHEPNFVAIDSYRAIGDLLRSPDVARSFAYDLSVQLAANGATTFLVGEYTSGEVHHVLMELAVADGVIELGTRREEFTAIREIEIVKMRGADFVSGRHFYEIGVDGLRFFPRVRATEGDDLDVAGSRETTGVAGLDTMFHGGIPKGSATIFQGGTGTGKTLLSLQFLAAGANLEQPCAYFTLEETPSQLRRNARSIGWDLEALERAGLLTIVYASPVEMSTDRFLDRSRQVIRETKAERVVYDSLSTLALGVPSERRFKELAYAMAKHAREASVTAVLTMETEQLLGSTLLSAHGVSFIADNLVQLRYVEVGGRLERSISVLKARGLHHDSDARALVISGTGIAVEAERFKDLRGVITGLAVKDSP